MKRISHYASLMRRIALRFDYRPTDCFVRCYEAISKERGVYLPDIGRVVPAGGMEVKSVYGGRQSFESVFTWTTLALQQPTPDMIKLIARYQDGLTAMGYRHLTTHELALLIAFEKHVAIQTGKFNSIFVGMEGGLQSEYDQAELCAGDIVRGSRFLNKGELPELGTEKRNGMMSSVIRLYTNTCIDTDDKDYVFPEDKLVGWHEWAQAYLETTDAEERRAMRLARFQQYGWWNEEK